DPVRRQPLTGDDVQVFGGPVLEPGALDFDAAPAQRPTKVVVITHTGGKPAELAIRLAPLGPVRDVHQPYLDQAAPGVGQAGAEVQVEVADRERGMPEQNVPPLAVFA